MGRRKKKTVLGTLGRGTAAGIKGLAKGGWWVAKKVGKGMASGTKAAHAQMKKSKAERAKAKRKKESPPAQFRAIGVKEEVKGAYDSFEDKLLHESLIIAVCGKRGSGKSTLGFRLMENLHAKRKRPCFVLGVGQGVLPGWIDSVDTLDDTKNGGVVLVDEGAVDFSSRSSMSRKNKELAELLAVARHKDLSLILVTQNTGMLDKNVMKLCDTIILKQGSLLQQEMERPVVKKLYSKVGNRFDGLNRIEKKSHAYVFDADFEGFLDVSLPSFWSDKISKSRA